MCLVKAIRRCDHEIRTRNRPSVRLSADSAITTPPFLAQLPTIWVLTSPVHIHFRC